MDRVRRRKLALHLALGLCAAVPVGCGETDPAFVASPEKKSAVQLSKKGSGEAEAGTSSGSSRSTQEQPNGRSDSDQSAGPSSESGGTQQSGFEGQPQGAGPGSGAAPGELPPVSGSSPLVASETPPGVSGGDDTGTGTGAVGIGRGGDSDTEVETLGDIVLFEEMGMGGERQHPIDGPLTGAVGSAIGNGSGPSSGVTKPDHQPKPNVVRVVETGERGDVISGKLDRAFFHKSGVQDVSDIVSVTMQPVSLEGTVTLMADGTFVYRPRDEQYYGSETASFTVTDKSGSVYEVSLTFEVEKRKHLLVDSFERDNLFVGGSESFGWHALIEDRRDLNVAVGDVAESGCVRSVCALILEGGTFGGTPEQVAAGTALPPLIGGSDGTRSFAFWGREGSCTHNVYLVTRAFDLTFYDDVRIEFDYQLVGLGDWDDGVERRDYYGDGEFFRVDVCGLGPKACGLGDDHSGYDEPALSERGKWVTLFEPTSDYVGGQAASASTGRGTGPELWKKASIEVQLEDLLGKNPEFKRSQLTFRLRGRIQDGFVGNNLRNKIEDAVFVDHFKLIAE